MINQHGVTRRQIFGIMFSLIVITLVLVACGGGDDKKPAIVKTSTPAPTFPPPPPPTWTVAPTLTLAPTNTLAPTATSSIVDATFLPPLVTGWKQLGDQVVVTVRQEDLNDAIAAVYLNTFILEASAIPVITLRTGYQMELHLQFTNPFLDKVADVTTRVRVRYDANGVYLTELIDRRDVQGIEIADESIWGSLTVIETGINTIVFDILSENPDADQLRLNNVLVYPNSHLEAHFVSFGED